MAVCPEFLNISLCAGAGGLDLALDLAMPGARTVAYVEREAYAAATLVARMEKGELDPALVWSDIATFDARPFRGRVHQITSGDPCQPNSNAGRRLGAADERFLIDQVVRIFDESGAHRLFRENVPGNADGQLAAIVPPLERLGCRVAAGIFSAAIVGGKHRRERLVIMADRSREREQGGSGNLSRSPDEDCPRATHGLGWHAIDRDGNLAHAGRSDGDARSDVPGGATRQGAAGQLGRSGIVVDDASGRGRFGRRISEPARWLDQADPVGGGFQLVYATGERPEDGRPEPEFRSGRDSIAGAGGELVHADDGRRARLCGAGQTRASEPGDDLGDANGADVPRGGGGRR